MTVHFNSTPHHGIQLHWEAFTTTELDGWTCLEVCNLMDFFSEVSWLDRPCNKLKGKDSLASRGWFVCEI